jgi:hypothetical protein
MKAMLCKSRPIEWNPGLILGMAFFFLGYFGTPVPTVWADERLYALNVYAGRMTSNNWDEFIHDTGGLDFKDSYLVTAALARRIGTYGDKASFEIEGQIVKHFNIQTHWELNALVAARWEAFWWDHVLDTSVAFGLGPSYATDKPEIEIANDGDTARFLIYWMFELAVGLPDYPRVALITRIHHRSNAFGWVADNGGSNVLALGLKWRF